MNKISIGSFTRISKTKARRIYEKGNKIYLLPCKLSPINIWFLPVEIKKDNIDFYNKTFDNVCNEFWFYCCNNEMGNYISFYEKAE